MKKTFRDKLKYEIILRDFPEKNRSSRCQSDGSGALIKPQKPPPKQAFIVWSGYGFNSQFWGSIQYKRTAGPSFIWAISGISSQKYKC